MAELDLTGQATLAGQVQTRVTQLRNAMELRKPVWNKLSIEKKKLWISSNKDPIMTLAWDVFKYLQSNFFDQGE